MIDLVPATTIGVFGPVASGKTHLFKIWLQKENRVVAFDSTGELMSEPSFQAVWGNPEELIEIVKASPYYFKVAYVPGKPLLTHFNVVLKTLWLLDSQKLLAVDEFHMVCPNNMIDDDMETLLRFSRHAKLGIIGMSQRIADVHKLFTSACRLVILFYTQEARDLIAIRDRWGSKVEKAVMNLRPLIYDDDTKVTHQIPQCVVCRKGAGFQVYDFATNTFLKSGAEPSTSVPVEETEPSPEDTPTVSSSEPDESGADEV